MTLLYTSPQFLAHETGAHPECPARLVAIENRLAVTGLLDVCERPEFGIADAATLAAVHAPSYMQKLDAKCDAGGGRIEADTVVSRGSWQAAQLAAGAACAAVHRVMAGADRTALCLVRPPGHHALPGGAMGFCLLNNVAIAARYAIDQLQLNRVLVVDWDVHHGNGTQDAFFRDEQVGFLSLHRFPFYPGTGDDDETGAGPGLGTTLNVPLPFGIPRQTYIDQFSRALEQMAARMRPELILLSAGFDAHRADPIGSLGLESEDFTKLTEIVLAAARTYCDGRVVSLLEGGYNTKALAESVELHLRALLASP